MVIELPPRFDTLSALDLCSRIFTSAGSISIEIRQSVVYDLFAACYLQNVISQIRQSGRSVKIESSLKWSTEKMGLANFLSGSNAMVTVQNSPGDRILPFTKLTKSDLIALANQRKAAYVPDTIEQESSVYASLLTQGKSENHEFALSYCIEEILRNAFQHSDSEEIYLGGRYNAVASRVEVVFADKGRGIKKSLGRNSAIQASSELHAIRLALHPGITGTSRFERTLQGHWENAGYGLFMTQRLCRENGIFELVSNDAYLRLSGNVESEASAQCGGTIVGLTIDLEVLSRTTKKSLKVFLVEGKEAKLKTKDIAMLNSLQALGIISK